MGVAVECARAGCCHGTSLWCSRLGDGAIPQYCPWVIRLIPAGKWSSLYGQREQSPRIGKTFLIRVHEAGLGSERHTGNHWFSQSDST